MQEREFLDIARRTIDVLTRSTPEDWTSESVSRRTIRYENWKLIPNHFAQFWVHRPMFLGPDALPSLSLAVSKVLYPEYEVSYQGDLRPVGITPVFDASGPLLADLYTAITGLPSGTHITDRGLDMHYTELLAQLDR